MPTRLPSEDVMSSRFHLATLSALILSGVGAVVWISRSAGQYDEPKPKKVKAEKPPKEDKPPLSPEEQLWKAAEKALRREVKEREKLLKEMANVSRRQETARPERSRNDRRESVAMARPDPKMPAWFSQLDPRHEGQITLHDWLDAGGALEDFIRMDLNRDGLLTHHEMVLVLSAQNHGHDQTGEPEYVRIDRETDIVIEGSESPGERK
jgi:hypothetical protein